MAAARQTKTHTNGHSLWPLVLMARAFAPARPCHRPPATRHIAPRTRHTAKPVARGLKRRAVVDRVAAELQQKVTGSYVRVSGHAHAPAQPCGNAGSGRA